MSSFEERIKKVHALEEQQSIDLLIITHSTDFRYFTGYPFWNDERLLALVIPSNAEPFVIGNALYKLQLDSIDIPDKILWKDGDDPYGLLKQELERRGADNPASIAVEDSATATIALSLQALYPEAKLSLASALTSPLRRVKDASEIDLLQEAARRAETAFSAALSRGAEWIGHTEREFSEELSYQLNKVGAPGGGLVAVGANAAQPHHVVDDTKIREQELLLVDYGTEYQGYHSDETRTVFFGDPDEEFIHIYDIVRHAYELGIAQAKPGNRLEDVDIAARSYIAEQGYGDYFNHRVGHGIGLDTHEFFSVNTGVKDRIEIGNVFSVEPGIYIPDKLGIRIESLVAIHDDGPRLLHQLPVALRTFQ